MKRRFLSVLLALSMALTLTPAAAWADGLSAEPAQETPAGQETPTDNPDGTQEDEQAPEKNALVEEQGADGADAVETPTDGTAADAEEAPDTEGEEPATDADAEIMPAAEGEEDTLVVAEEVTEADAVAYTGTTTKVYYKTLDEAVKAAAGKITLTKRANVTETATWNDVEIETNGNRISVAKGATLTLGGANTRITNNASSALKQPMLQTVDGGKLVIEDGEYISKSPEAIIIWGEAEISGGTFKCSVTTTTDNNFDGKGVIVVNGLDGSAKATGALTMTGGKIVVDDQGQNPGYAMHGLTLFNGGSAVLGTEGKTVGPEIEANYCAVGMNNYQAPVNLTVYGGKYTCTKGNGNEKFNALIYISAKSVIDIQGGEFTAATVQNAEKAYVFSIPYKNVDAKLTVSNGTFNAAQTFRTVTQTDADKASGKPSVSITGGTFKEAYKTGDDVTGSYGEYVAANCTVAENGGTWVVKPADGLIGEKGTAGSTTTVTITGDATSGKVDDDNTEEGSLGGNANKITVDASGGGQEAKADAAVTIPADTAQTMENVNAIEVKADNVTVELPAASVKNIAEAAKGEDVETVTITVKQDATTEQKVAAQYTVEVKSGATDLLGAGNANGTIKITVPKPDGSEFFVYWVSADGKNVLGEMVFAIEGDNIVITTTHLSTYQVRTEAAPVAEAVYTKDDGSQASGTLSQAVENAKNGTKILLNNDVKLGAGLTIAKDRNIAIEGNNHTITMDATATDTVMFNVQNGGSSDSDKNIKGKLTLENVTLDGSQKEEVRGIVCRGDLILTNAIVTGFKYSGGDNGGVLLTHKATMTMSGGSIQGNEGKRYDEAQLQYSHYADDLWVGSEAKATLQDGAQVGRVFVNANGYSGSVPDNGLTVNDATVEEAFTEADSRAAKSGTVIVAAGEDGTIKKLIIALGRTQSDMDLGRTTAVAENVSAANGEIKTEYSDATFKIPAGLTVKLTEGNLTEKLEIGAGATVIIPESVTVTVKASGDPAEAPEITNNGTLQVDGALIAGANDAATTTDDVYLNISGSGKIEAGAGATVDIDPNDENTKTLTFTFHLKDGTDNVIEKKAFVATNASAEFSAIKPADPERSGYTFKGWFAAETGGTAIADDAQFAESTDFYAQWSKKSKPRPDAGGSGGGASAATSTVTISSDGSSIKADVKISNGTATIGKVDDIKKVIGEDVVTIDASNLKKDVDTVKVDSSIVNAIANNEDSEGLEVKLSDGTVTFDAAAVAGFKGGDLSVTWDKTNTNSLNSKQKDAVKDMDVQGSYKLTLNKALKNGEAEIRAAFAVPDGKDASDLALLRVGTDGTTKEVSARFSGGELRFTATESGDYVVVVKAGEQTTEPAEPTSPAQNNTDFRDVDAGAWYGNAVNYVAANGLMSGVGDGLFAPNTNLSRAMLAQILYNHAGRPAADGASAFTDVPAGMWYTNAVAWATAQGVVSGYGNGLFGPNDNITREQLAVMLYRYAGSPAAEGSLGSFADAGKVSAYAQNALIWATTNGVMSGKGGGNLDPAGMATRAEVAQMLYNYLNR